MEDVILSPVITERSMQMIKIGKYTFKVAKNSDKRKIKKAVKDKFGVDAVSVATIIVKPTKKNVNRREITVPAFKKAIVKIKSGQKIDLFDVGGSK